MYISKLHLKGHKNTAEESTIIISLSRRTISLRRRRNFTYALCPLHIFS